MINLLLTNAFYFSQDQLEMFDSLGYRAYCIQDERIPLQKQALPFSISDIHAVVCNGLFLYNDIKDFSNLQFVQLTSTGYDRFPLQVIDLQRIEVNNAGNVYSIPVAEWAVLKLLEIYKKTRLFYECQASHKWEKHRDIRELTDTVVSIIGLGNIGTEIAKRLTAFGCRVIGVDVHQPESEYIDEFHMITDIDDLLSQCDTIILSLPLTNTTRHFIDKTKLSSLKHDAVLINVSRGAVIDEKALISTLKEGKLLGVALDVFEEEPLARNSPLWTIERVIVTPHISFVSDKVNDRLFALIAKNLADFSRVSRKIDENR